jgi:hypothetical protein
MALSQNRAVPINLDFSIPIDDSQGAAVYRSSIRWRLLLLIEAAWRSHCIFPIFSRDTADASQKKISLPVIRLGNLTFVVENRMNESFSNVYAETGPVHGSNIGCTSPEHTHAETACRGVRSEFTSTRT